MSAKFLEDWVPYTEFAKKEVKRHPRTVDRWTRSANGLPYAMLGRIKMIHIPTARQWLLGRMRNPNPSRQ